MDYLVEEAKHVLNGILCSAVSGAFSCLQDEKNQPSLVNLKVGNLYCVTYHWDLLAKAYVAVYYI